MRRPACVGAALGEAVRGDESQMRQTIGAPHSQRSSGALVIGGLFSEPEPSDGVEMEEGTH